MPGFQSQPRTRIFRGCALSTVSLQRARREGWVGWDSDLGGASGSGGGPDECNSKGGGGRGQSRGTDAYASRAALPMGGKATAQRRVAHAGAAPSPGTNHNNGFDWMARLGVSS